MMDDSLKRAMKLTHEQKILLRLVHGELVAKEDLLDLLYGDRPDGGPMNAEQCMKVSMMALRERLRRDGWDIETVRCYGVGVGKGRTFDGCPRTEQRKSSSPISERTGASFSPRTNCRESPAVSRERPSRSQSPAHGLTDFLSSPSQRIAS
jgi:DNA-binding winged helix-turn-helix (wHTH) protein